MRMNSELQMMQYFEDSLNFNCVSSIFKRKNNKGLIYLLMENLYHVQV